MEVVLTYLLLIIFAGAVYGFVGWALNNWYNTELIGVRGRVDELEEENLRLTVKLAKTLEALDQANERLHHQPADIGDIGDFG